MFKQLSALKSNIEVIALKLIVRDIVLFIRHTNYYVMLFKNIFLITRYY